MTDNPFTMSDADLLKRYRRALAEAMTECIWVHDNCARALFGEKALIHVECDPPPIPDRKHDWSAIDAANYDGGDPVGYGETEVEAILDLLDKMEAKND